jgi:hypothetical protein
MVEDDPWQMNTLDTFTTGRGFTVTVTKAVLLQPFAFDPVTAYVVDAVGVTTIELVIFPVGDQL